MNRMNQTILSFSGGKDSIFALYQLQQQKIPVVSLITTIWKASGQSVAHDESFERLEKQARWLNIPIEFVETDFENYTTDFEKKLKELKVNQDIKQIAFGDIYLKGHRDWGEQLASRTGLNPFYPLWRSQEESTELLYEYVRAGFKSKITKIDPEKLPESWIGRELDEQFIADILTFDVCPLGESGEYHTYVYDGPNFQKVNR